MQLGMIGLGRMGGNMVRRLMRDKHACVVYDRSPESVETSWSAKARRRPPRWPNSSRSSPSREAAWVMVPAGGPTEATVAELGKLIEPCDIIIDGGNSYFKDDIRRATELKPKGIHYVDVGTSGGIWGIDRGYCMMISASAEAMKHLDPIFKTLAQVAAISNAPPARTRYPAPRKRWLPALRPVRFRPLRKNGP